MIANATTQKRSATRADKALHTHVVLQYCERHHTEAQCNTRGQGTSHARCTAATANAAKKCNGAGSRSTQTGSGLGRKHKHKERESHKILHRASKHSGRGSLRTPILGKPRGTAETEGKKAGPGDTEAKGCARAYERQCSGAYLKFPEENWALGVVDSVAAFVERPNSQQTGDYLASQR